MKLLQALGFGAMCGLAMWIVLDAASMPDVWFSYSTDECVKVINYDKNDKYSCENLPSKFNHVWVQ
jgi:hypothetical protein